MEEKKKLTILSSILFVLMTVALVLSIVGIILSTKSDQETKANFFTGLDKENNTQIIEVVAGLNEISLSLDIGQDDIITRLKKLSTVLVMSIL